jgi:tRNA G18 (ribose-2'-O)-methylase SpoU
MRRLQHDEISKNRLKPEEVHDKERNPVYVLIDNVRSLYNVGSIFRTSDGALIQKLILCGYTPHPPRHEIEKTALGATNSVPWEYFKNPIEVIKRLRDEGIKIIALEHTDSSIPYYELKPSNFPACLVVGNEIKGIQDEILQYTDIAIEIPMFGVKQSLNVAVAYGIALYDIVRVLKKDELK